MFRSRKPLCVSVAVCVAAIAAVLFCYDWYKDQVLELQQRRTKIVITEFAASRALFTHETLTRIMVTAQEQAAILGQFAVEDMPLRIRLYSASIFEHGCKSIGFIDLNGTLHTASGIVARWDSQAFMAQIGTGRPFMSDSETDPLDNEPVNVAVAPVFSGGRMVGAFAILFTNQQMNLAFRVTAANTKGPSFLISGQGEVISASIVGLLAGTNIFTAMHNKALTLAIPEEVLVAAMRRDKSGVTGCEIEGRRYFLAYAPVQLNGWYALSLLPENYQQEESAALADLDRGMFLSFGLILSGVLLYMLLVHAIATRSKRSDCKRIQTITENLPGGILRVHNDGHFFRILEASPGLYSMTGYTPEEFHQNFGENYLEFVYPEDRERVLLAVQATLAEQACAEIEYRVCTKNGQLRWFLGRGQAPIDVNIMDCVVLDITEKKMMEEHAAVDAQRYRLLFDLSGSIFFEYDCDSHTLTVGHGFKEKFGYMPDTSRLPDSLLESGLIHRNDREKLNELLEQVRMGQPSGEATMRIRKASGRHVWCRIEEVHMYGAQMQLIKIIGKITDADQQVRAMERLSRESQRDPFTRLLNKVSTREMVDRYIAQSSPDECGAMCIIDLDAFKSVNDTYGHETGDAVIFQAAKHLRQSFRSSDIMGRIGGDEFLVYFKGLPNIEVLMPKLEKLRELFREGCYVNGVDLRMTMSVGIALYPQHGVSFAKLYRAADKALYQAKITRDSIAVYDEDTAQTTE